MTIYQSVEASVIHRTLDKLVPTGSLGLIVPVHGSADLVAPVGVLVVINKKWAELLERSAAAMRKHNFESVRLSTPLLKAYWLAAGDLSDTDDGFCPAQQVWQFDGHSLWLDEHVNGPQTYVQSARIPVSAVAGLLQGDHQALSLLGVSGTSLFIYSDYFGELTKFNQVLESQAIEVISN